MFPNSFDNIFLEYTAFDTKFGTWIHLIRSAPDDKIHAWFSLEDFL
jgi:hypothetical protein